MPQILKDINREQFFYPTRVGILTNALYFIKGGIRDGLTANAAYMKGVMLDFGCGPKPYERLFCVDKHIGLDYGESSHDHHDSQIDVLYDGRNIPFASETFDSVLAVEVFEHVLDLDWVLGELHRVMKPDAHILITVPFIWGEHETPHDYIRFTSYGVAALLERKGFQVVQTEKTTNAVETCVQLWNAYATRNLLPKSRFLRSLFFAGIMAPTTALGVVLSRLLPDDRTLYLTNVIVAQK